MTSDHSNASLGSDELLAMYREMVLCRVLDERLWVLNRQGKAAIVASSQGHEAAQIGSVHALKKGHDQFYIYYRDLAVLVSIGVTPYEVMLSFLAKIGEPASGARQFPMHGAYTDHKIVNLSNVVATQIPQAVGSALATKLRGEDVVTIVYFGDGASSVGDCHEGMNFAAIHKLPVIFFCENNRYAISVPQAKQMNVEDVAGRAEGYGMPGLIINGADVTAVYEATVEAAIRARLGHGPTLIEAKVERYLPHTSDDDDRLYRNEEEINEARLMDPLKILRSQLKDTAILSEPKDKEIYRTAKLMVDKATDDADSAPFPGTEGFYEHLYASSRDGIDLGGVS